MHYGRWTRHGDPDVVKPPGRRREPQRPSYVKMVETFLRHVPDLPDDQCWPYEGTIHHTGYGIVSVYIGRGRGNVRQDRAHRFAYKYYVGPIPDGLIVRHKCDNRLCVNPHHLVLGTNGDNARDRSERGRSYHGEGNPNAKITDAQRHEITRRYLAGGVTQQSLADEYGVHQASVSSIIIKERGLDR